MSQRRFVFAESGKSGFVLRVSDDGSHTVSVIEIMLYPLQSIAMCHICNKSFNRKLSTKPMFFKFIRDGVDTCIEFP
jgi:hypothetical protein